MQSSLNSHHKNNFLIISLPSLNIPPPFPFNSINHSKYLKYPSLLMLFHNTIYKTNNHTCLIFMQTPNTIILSRHFTHACVLPSNSILTHYNKEMTDIKKWRPSLWNVTSKINFTLNVIYSRIRKSRLSSCQNGITI